MPERVGGGVGRCEQSKCFTLRATQHSYCLINGAQGHVTCPVIYFLAPTVVVLYLHCICIVAQQMALTGSGFRSFPQFCILFSLFLMLRLGLCQNTHTHSQNVCSLCGIMPWRLQKPLVLRNISSHQCSKIIIKLFILLERGEQTG